MTPDARQRSHQHAADLVQAGRYEDAIALYRGLQEADWRDLRALTALRDLFKKLERRPELAEQFSILARHHLESKRTEQAVDAMKKAVELDPRRPGMHLRLALVLVRAGRPEHARFAFYEAAHWSHCAGRDDDARRILLRSLEACGDPYAAVKRLTETQKTDRTFKTELERRYLYRCLGWPSDGASKCVAEAELALAKQGIETAILPYVRGLIVGGQPRHFSAEFHRLAAEWFRLSDPERAERHRRHAEKARKVPNTVH